LDDVFENVKNGFKTYLGSDQQYFEIDISKMPKDAKKIIIELSY
jgi:hypothetical protein